MNNQLWIFRTTVFDLNPDALHYYPFMISLDKCDESCNNVEDPFVGICFPNKIENVNLKVFNIIKQINESKTLVKYI